MLKWKVIGDCEKDEYLEKAEQNGSSNLSIFPVIWQCFGVHLLSWIKIADMSFI